MKKLLLVLSVLAFSTACKAEGSKQITELKKRCEDLTKENTSKDEVYLYGSGKLKNFARLEPPSDTPVRLERPDPYGADFIMPDKKQIRISIRGVWKNPKADLDNLELMPLNVEIGRSYQFCYRIIKINSEDFFYIDYPETIQLIKE